MCVVEHRTLPYPTPPYREGVWGVVWWFPTLVNGVGKCGVRVGREYNLIYEKTMLTNVVEVV